MEHGNVFGVVEEARATVDMEITKKRKDRDGRGAVRERRFLSIACGDHLFGDAARGQELLGLLGSRVRQDLEGRDDVVRRRSAG